MRTLAFSPPIMADVLLHEWENRALKAHDAAYAVARPLAVAALGALVYRPGDLALDLEDVRDALRRARAFGISIKSRRGQGYYIAETEQLPPGWPQLFAAVELQAFLRLPSALAPFVQPDTRRSLGLEHLRPLLWAVQARQVLEFQYQKHWEATPETRTMGPLLLKEFRGRWYVLGMMAWSGNLAYFGLDRISGLRATRQAFEPPTGFDAATYYAHAFGITRPDDGSAPLEIRLRFTPTQGRYVLGYPLHASQQLLLQSDTEICLSLTVFDTHDLRMELLSYGPSVAVLAPASLRQWLQAQHAAAGALAAA